MRDKVLSPQSVWINRVRLYRGFVPQEIQSCTKAEQESKCPLTNVIRTVVVIYGAGIVRRTDTWLCLCFSWERLQQASFALESNQLIFDFRGNRADRNSVRGTKGLYFV